MKLLANLILPKIRSRPKISNLKFMFKKPYLSQYLMDSNKIGVQNLSYAINLKLRLIKFVCFFKTPGRFEEKCTEQ